MSTALPLETHDGRPDDTPEPCPRCHAPCSVRQARLWVETGTPAACRQFAERSLLTAGSRVTREIVDDAVIVVAELVTASYVARARLVELAIEVHVDHVAVIVRDDRVPGPQPVSSPDVREMLLDALTVARETFRDGRATVHVARLNLPG
jgi:hypothetical protein